MPPADIPLPPCPCPKECRSDSVRLSCGRRVRTADACPAVPVEVDLCPQESALVFAANLSVPASVSPQFPHHSFLSPISLISQLITDRKPNDIEVIRPRAPVQPIKDRKRKREREKSNSSRIPLFPFFFNVNSGQVSYLLLPSPGVPPLPSPPRCGRRASTVASREAALGKVRERNVSFWPPCSLLHGSGRRLSGRPSSYSPL